MERQSKSLVMFCFFIKDKRDKGVKFFLSCLTFFFVSFVKLYRLLISPILPGTCRFTPSCSEYALQAFAAFGPFRALWLTVRRVLRCNPFCEGGHDPIKQYLKD